MPDIEPKNEPSGSKAIRAEIEAIKSDLKVIFGALKIVDEELEIEFNTKVIPEGKEYYGNRF